ncbi:MAG TPA: paraquat-inducible protein A, partial [Methylibium sp.]
ERGKTEGLTPRCRRCDAPLMRSAGPPPDLPLALALTSLAALAVAHTNPILGIEVQGRQQQASLWQAAMTLYDDQAAAMALLVLLTTLIAPLTEAIAVVWVLLPLRQGCAAPGAPWLLRALQRVRPWVMIEVFMLGVLVSTVKLAAIASIQPGIGLGAFAVAMLAIAGVGQSFDPERAWQALAEARKADTSGTVRHRTTA